jgi:hypothetical protein
MAEDSLFWTTSDTGDGAAAGYTQAEINTWLRMMMVGDTADEGVAKGYENELAVTNPSGRDLSVNTGGAWVYGFPYWNTAAVTLSLTHPTTGTTGWRVVVRADWTAQTVRVALKESADGTATAPALTQTANTTWEISLATGTITTGDVIAVTDTRVFVHPNIEVDAAMMENRTRTLWVPCVSGAEDISADIMTHLSAIGWDMPDGEDWFAYGDFYLPSDWVSGLTISAVVLASGTGNCYCSHTAYYGAAGQAYNAHTETSALGTVAVTANQLAAIKVLTPGSLAAGDYVSLQFFRNGAHASDTVGATVYFKGWLVSYTADS